LLRENVCNVNANMTLLYLALKIMSFAKNAYKNLEQILKDFIRLDFLSMDILVV